MKIKIVLIEDERNLGDTLQTYLIQEGYEVTWFQNISSYQNSNEQLLLLDWMLPDGQGIDLLKSLRKNGYSKPVIFLTARADLIDRVLGLESGANDYITKPFEPRELLARIRVQLRSDNASEKKAPPTKQSFGDIHFDFQTRQVFLKDKEVSLTKIEFELLKLLCESAEKVFTRDELLNRVWGYDQYPTTRTVDTHILQLRNIFGEHYFETLRGIGYRFTLKGFTNV